MAQRSARREARPRAEADAGHRKRALLPLPGRKAYRACSMIFAIERFSLYHQNAERPEAVLPPGALLS